MTAPDGFDRLLTTWLEERAPMREPDDLLRTVEQRLERARRLPGWVLLERWLPMQTQAKLGAIPRSAIVLVTLGLLGALLAAIAIAAQPDPSPRPVACEAVLCPISLPSGGGAQHTATLLLDGRVVIVGGGSDAASGSAELWDPGAETFSPTGPLSSPRTRHTATLLLDGSVLVVGGGPEGEASGGPMDHSAERWDPTSGLFRTGGHLRQARMSHTATRLSDGRVLVVGGENPDSYLIASAEIWDPRTGAFEATGSLPEARSRHTATLLPDDRVLIIGGRGGDFWNTGEGPVSAQIWDPVSGTFSPAGSLGTGRAGHTATLLVGGDVLVVGGEATSRDPGLVSAEVWDHVTGAFRSTGSLSAGRAAHTATLLADGRVLVVGGYGLSGESGAMAVEIWDPASGSFHPAASVNGYQGHTATLVADGRVLIVGPYVDTWTFHCVTEGTDQVLPDPSGRRCHRGSMGPNAVVGAALLDARVRTSASLFALSRSVQVPADRRASPPHSTP